MNAVPTGSSPNSLIAALPRRQRLRLLRACEPAEMAPSDVLCELGQPYRYAYFPNSGWISQVSSLDGQRPLESGLIGHEGMLGATVLLGVDVAPMRAVVQGPGTAMRIPVAGLRRALRDGPALRKVLGRYLCLRVAELSFAAACTHFHQIDQRLARLLLRTHDRAGGEPFPFTQVALAEMLGVRRSGVSVAAGALQTCGIIAYSRGEITILDRPGLESACCECYELLNARRDQMWTDDSGKEP